MKVELSLDIDTEECFDMQDIIYEVKKECIRQVINIVSVDTITQPARVLAEEIMTDPEVKALMNQRKEQIKQIIRGEIEEGL